MAGEVRAGVRAVDPSEQRSRVVKVRRLRRRVGRFLVVADGSARRGPTHQGRQTAGAVIEGAIQGGTSRVSVTFGCSSGVRSGVEATVSPVMSALCPVNDSELEEAISVPSVAREVLIDWRGSPVLCAEALGSSVSCPASLLSSSAKEFECA